MYQMFCVYSNGSVGVRRRSDDLQQLLDEAERRNRTEGHEGRYFVAVGEKEIAHWYALEMLSFERIRQTQAEQAARARSPE